MSEENIQTPLKIALLLDRFVPSRGGERYFSLLATGLAHKGHDVHVFASEVEDAEGVPYTVHLLPVIRSPRSLHILSFLFSSSRALRGHDFDIVHGEGLATAINVYNPHGGAERAYLKQEFASIEKPAYRIIRYMKHYLSPRHYLEKGVQARLFASPRVKQIIAVSEMVKNDIMVHHHVDSGRIAVVFDSIDTERFHPENRERFREGLRRSLHIHEETPVLLFASNNYRLKGLHILLSALTMLKEGSSGPPPCLIVLGRGRREYYRQMAEKMGITPHVRFVGPVADIHRYYAASDLYVHPTFYDSCALTILEALATGLPVVTTRFAGAARIVEDGVTGEVLANPADSRSLARAIAKCLEPAFRERARSLARNAAVHFSPDYNIDETIKVYRDVVRNRTGR